MQQQLDNTFVAHIANFQYKAIKASCGTAMASEFRLHRPYVLATLPRPLDHTDGNTVAREVYGQRGGQRKKKRTELAVGIDGENASIYDV